jgi:curved DNA-binding protein CbpA
MDPQQFKARITQIHRDLDAYTYYDLLNLPPDTSPDDIRRAFHRMALTIHPDRHRQSSDPEMQRQVYAIYKRLSEGYRVLMNHDTRREYDECLKRGERRLVKKERPRVKRDEDAIKNPQAKKFFRMAETFERSGDLKNAKINFKFALDLEPDNAAIKARFNALDQG